MKKLTRSVAVVSVGSAAGLVMAGGVAYAFWTANGTGQAAGKAGTVAAVNATVATLGTSATLLYPGVSVPATVNIHNPNDVAVKVTGYSIAAAAQPTSVSNPANASCTAATSAVSVALTTASSLTTSIPAGGDVTIATAGTPITMGTGSDNGCQGATFTFSNVTVTAQVG